MYEELAFTFWRCQEYRVLEDLSTMWLKMEVKVNSKFLNLHNTNLVRPLIFYRFCVWGFWNTIIDKTSFNTSTKEIYNIYGKCLHRHKIDIAYKSQLNMVLDMKHEINMNFFIDSFISVLRRITVSITLNDNNFTLYRKRIIFSMNDIRKALNRRLILIFWIISL